MRKSLAVASLILLAACVSEPSAPPPPPGPAPAAPLPRPAPIAQDWRDWPLTPGTWIYRADATGTSAMYGRAGAEADLILRCDLAGRKLILSWPATMMAGAAGVTITTSHGGASYPATAAVGTAGRVGIGFPTNDPFLDRLAFSRGRFVVAPQSGAAGRLVIPAWPEPGRAIEDCRR